jgi:hypothetical protein
MVVLPIQRNRRRWYDCKLKMSAAFGRLALNYLKRYNTLSNLKMLTGRAKELSRLKISRLLAAVSSTTKQPARSRETARWLDRNST